MNQWIRQIVKYWNSNSSNTIPTSHSLTFLKNKTGTRNSSNWTSWTLLVWFWSDIHVTILFGALAVSPSEDSSDSYSSVAKVTPIPLQPKILSKRDPAPKSPQWLYTKKREDTCDFFQISVSTKKLHMRICLRFDHQLNTFNLASP